MTRADDVWELAVAVNAAFKGLLGSMDESGHICAATVPVSGLLDVDAGWDAVRAELAARLADVVHGGEVVVVADKVVAAALGRVGPRRVLAEPDPKTVPPARLPALAERWTRELGFLVTSTHLLLADEYGEDTTTLGTDDPNRRAAELAEAVAARGPVVDCIVSDTDTGIDTRAPLIGTITIGATPLGATAGVNLYEAMRCAVAAEFVRGHRRVVPAVVCRPADRRRARPGTGRPRHYTGFLDAAKEDGITHA